MDHHTLAINVADFEERSLGAAYAGSVEDHEDDPVQPVRGCLDHLRDLLGAQHHRQLPGNLGKDQVVIGDIPPFQNLPVQETQSRHAPLDSAGGEFLLFEQLKLELAYLVAAESLRRLTEILRKLFDGQNVAASRGW